MAEEKEVKEEFRQRKGKEKCNKTREGVEKGKFKLGFERRGKRTIRSR